MTYKKTVSSTQMMSLIDGKPEHKKNLYIRENIGDKSTFLKHVEIGNQSRSMVGTSLNDGMAVLTRVSDGDKVKYSTNKIKTPQNLRRVLRNKLKMSEHTKSKVGKQTRSKGKVGKRTRSKGGKHSRSKVGKHSRSKMSKRNRNKSRRTKKKGSRKSK